jgi:hypothetical protein
MIGPKPKGHYTNSKATLRKDFLSLVRGKRYRVANTFLDNDKQVHRAGESWMFLDYTVSGPGEIVAFFVSFDGNQEWCIPMHIDSPDELVTNVQPE